MNDLDDIWCVHVFFILGCYHLGRTAGEMSVRCSVFTECVLTGVVVLYGEGYM